ncbi:hypothetical protein E2C01_096120 [Portunus trituberculatus]|uniref:Reverse transcriptase zinc-binding domain-containing protein n=1 Tax=Portunus trituberculatus TaxID=210409 RepID=A0A5B7K7F8_PORTR|nr:hypothetical protein [Portunus trituberculatus]
MGQYRSDSSLQPWVRKTSRKLDIALTHLRLGHTRLIAHLHRMSLALDPYCLWCISIPETINHFMLECPRFHSHCVVLQEQFRALGVTTFDLSTLLGATGIDLSRQSAVLHLTCAFLNKTNQLQRLREHHRHLTRANRIVIDCHNPNNNNNNKIKNSD